MNERPPRHFDEARQQVLDALQQMVQQIAVTRAVFSPDIFARIRVILWYEQDAPSAAQQAELENQFVAAAGPFWGGLWVSDSTTSTADQEMLHTLWDGGIPHDTTDKIRINERHRSLSVWLTHPLTPPWSADPESPQGPPIISFYGFKGGVGRSTALAIFAAQRAQAGERVVVIDLDLAAPGIGLLLADDPAMALAGVVDYWLELPLVGAELDLRDYYYRVSHPDVIGPGEILVLPTGHFDDLYPVKLARLDFTPPTTGKHPLESLLQQIHDELNPNWILLDARAGISEAAGFALGGLAHLNVLFGGTSDSGWRGLRFAIQRLGADRILRGLPQDQCLLVHSMVPANPQTAVFAQQAFLLRAEATFEQAYYLPDPDNPDEDQFWYIRDMDGRDAPHMPISLAYSEQIAFFTQLTDLITYGLRSADYQELHNRIVSRFPRMIS